MKKIQQRNPHRQPLTNPAKHSLRLPPPPGNLYIYPFKLERIVARWAKVKFGPLAPDRQ